MLGKHIFLIIHGHDGNDQTYLVHTTNIIMLVLDMEHLAGLGKHLNKEGNEINVIRFHYYVKQFVKSI